MDGNSACSDGPGTPYIIPKRCVIESVKDRIAKNTECANTCPKAVNISWSANDSNVIIKGGVNNSTPESAIVDKDSIGGGLGGNNFDGGGLDGDQGENLSGQKRGTKDQILNTTSIKLLVRDKTSKATTVAVLVSPGVPSVYVTNSGGFSQ